MGTCGTSGASDADRLVLREGGWCSRDIIAFMLARSGTEEEDSYAQKWADDSLLERGNNMGMDSGIHEAVLHSIEVVGEDIIVPCDAHVACDHHGHLICVSGW